MKHPKRSLWSLLFLSACQSAVPAVEAPIATPGETELFEGVYPDGPNHRLVIDVRGQRREVTVTEIGGKLMLEGDMVVGDAELLDGKHTRLYSVPTLGELWPGGVVPYVITGSLEDPERITAAMDLISQHSPVRFVVRTTESDYVRFVTSTDENVSSSKLGRQGGRQDIAVWLTHPAGVIAHELFHALGIFHEQSRSDRDDWISYHKECVKLGRRHNFTIEDGTVMTPFDFSSIMLYSSNSFADGCSPLTRKDGTTWNANRSMLSDEDINGLYLLYGRALGNIESDDEFGAALAAGDFDDDGYDDLAIGAPGEAPGDDPAAGAVFLYKGTAYGYTPWMWLSQASAFDGFDGLGANEAGDGFGETLVVGDFNGDGVDDLAVGAPNESVNGIAQAGAVYLYLGYANAKNSPNLGLRPRMVVTQSALGAGVDEAGDRFGTSLAAGDFDHDGDDDLAVGAPHEAAGGNPVDSGAVVLFRGGTIGLTYWKVLGQDTLGITSAGDLFGHALAAGDFDGDARTDLAVGAPGDFGSGSVFVFRGGAVAQLSAWQLLTQVPLFTAGANDGFGAALAAGSLNLDAADELVVGAPGSSMNRGRVYLFRGTGGAVGPVGLQTFTQPPLGVDEVNDRFGSAFAIGVLDGIGGQLVSAAPREVLSNGQRAGAVFLANGGTQPWLVLTEEGLDANEIDDRFGTALAMLSPKTGPLQDLAVAAPTEKLDSPATGLINRPNAGAVYLYRANQLGEMKGIQMITQESGSPRRP